jgi:hypothetical protein
MSLFHCYVTYCKDGFRVGKSFCDHVTHCASTTSRRRVRCPAGTVQRIQMNRLRRLGCISVIFLIVIACWLFWRAELKPRRDLERLLSGDAGIRISSICISGPEITIEMRDQATTEYLARAFRSAIDEGYVPERHGRPYYGRVEFGDGQSVKIGLTLPDNEDGFTILYPIDSFWMNDPKYYWVALPAPIPKLLADAIKRMKQ